MKLIEISYILENSTPKWPTNPDEKLEYILTLENDGCNASSVYHHMHNGTHVDAPIHFRSGGKTIDEISINDFFYERPLILELPKGYEGKIELSFLDKYKDEIELSDLLIIHTGFSEIREQNPKKYIKDYPTFSLEAARYLRREFESLKGVAFDVIGVDDSETGADEGFPVHHALLDSNEEASRPLLIFEDVNTKRIIENKDDMVAIAAFPIRWKGAEAAPVAMVLFCR